MDLNVHKNYWNLMGGGQSGCGPISGAYLWLIHPIGILLRLLQLSWSLTTQCSILYQHYFPLFYLFSFSFLPSYLNEKFHFDGLFSKTVLHVTSVWNLQDMYGWYLVAGSAMGDDRRWEGSCLSCWESSSKLWCLSK